MPHKGRISVEEKVRLVEEYITGKKSINAIAQQNSISSRTFLDWVRLYKTRGVEGLIPATRHREYSVEIKHSAIQDYLTGKYSLNEICTKYDISRHSMLHQWIKRYNNHKDFKQPISGGINYMVKGISTTQEERIEIVSHCISNNKNYGLTIEKYGVSYQQIYSWVRKYEVGGVEALSDRRGKRKDEVSMSEVEKLHAQLKLKEAENLRLQMENDLLKKLEALERGIDKD